MHEAEYKGPLLETRVHRTPHGLSLQFPRRVHKRRHHWQDSRLIVIIDGFPSLAELMRAAGPPNESEPKTHRDHEHSPSPPFHNYSFNPLTYLYHAVRDITQLIPGSQLAKGHPSWTTSPPLTTALFTPGTTANASPPCIPSSSGVMNSRWHLHWQPNS